MGDLGVDELSKFGRRSTPGLRSTIRKALADLGACERLADGVVQAGDDLGRRAALRCKAHPIFDHEVWKALLHDCRYICQGSDPFWGRHGKCAELACGNEVDDCDGSDEIELGHAVEKVDPALVSLRRNVYRTHPGL